MSKVVENNGMESSEEVNVGVLDIDLCGPSLPRIFGVEGEEVHRSGSGWSPVYVEDNLSLMSAGFLLPSLDSALIWRGPKKNGLIKQLLRDVDWGEGELDYLIGKYTIISRFYEFCYPLALSNILPRPNKYFFNFSRYASWNR